MLISFLDSLSPFSVPLAAPHTIENLRAQFIMRGCGINVRYIISPEAGNINLDEISRALGDEK